MAHRSSIPANAYPADGQFFDLPAGGVAKAEVACSKHYTTFGGANDVPETACPNDFNSLHEASADKTKGCAIAIAYKSDVRSIQPEDFVVISSNHQCPWKRDVEFEIPAGLPACPEGGCHCMWGWIHGQERGGDEMYMTGFKCKVSNPGNKALAAPKKPIRCEDGDCTGAKQPLFFSQVERANVENYGGEPPSYNDRYGYVNGAQNDIFSGGVQEGAPSTPSKTTSAGATPSSTDSTQPGKNEQWNNNGNNNGNGQENNNGNDQENGNDNGNGQESGSDNGSDNGNGNGNGNGEEDCDETESAAPAPTSTGRGRYHGGHRNKWHWNKQQNDENNWNNDNNNGWKKRAVRRKRTIRYARDY